MAITINGSGTITGVSAGGLPDGSITADDLASTLDLGSKTLTIPTDTTGLPSAGISEADQWRLTTNFQGSSIITTNLERVDNSGFGYLGTGMTQSSGVFTFPSTGYWLIRADAMFRFTSGSPYNVIYIETNTTGGGASGWTSQTESNTLMTSDSGANFYGSSDGEFIFDVTDTSTHKARFQIGVENSSVYTMGSSTLSKTYFTFIKLGDT